MSGNTAQILEFPPDFLWGSATAAHQVEGNNHNSDCWALEQAQPSLFSEPSGDAVDQWNRFADDVALLAAAGIQAYRFSVEWARIEPEPGRFSSSALDHYQRCIDACLARGVEPVLTLQHFSLPLWVAQRGGFAARDFPELFARYCGLVASRLSGYSTLCTINELNVPLLVADGVQEKLRSANGEALRGAAERALGTSLQSSFLFTPGDVLLGQGLAAHARGRDAIKAVRPELRVGITLAIQDEQAMPGAEAVRDRRIAEYITPFLDFVKGDDFIGVQNYTRSVARPDGSSGPEPGHRLTDMGYEDRPQSCAQVCRTVWEQTRTPILITENGWAGTDDSRRCDFIRESLGHIHAALADGVDIRGYFYWSLLDNFEWLAGYGPKFGLIGVDRSTQRRLLKPSALVFGAIAQANAIRQGPAVDPESPGPANRLTGAALGLG